MLNSQLSPIFPILTSTISQNYQSYPTRFSQPAPTAPPNHQNQMSMHMPIQMQRKSQNETCASRQSQKVIVDRQLTKNCWNQKIYTQEEVEKLRKEIVLKDQTILKLQQKINDLKVEGQYLIKSVQKFRDNNPSNLFLEEKEKVLQVKQMDIDYLKKQNSKLKQWLKQQKQQGLKCMQCVKMKDIVIEGLEQQINQIKGELSATKNIIQNLGLTGNNSEGMKKMNHFQQNQNERHFLDENKNRKIKIGTVGQEQKLKTHQNFITAQRNAKAQIANYPQIQSPILKLASIPSQQINPPTHNNQKYNLMSKKCIYLETQLEKLINAYPNNTLVNFIEQKQQSKRKKAGNRVQEVLKEEHFQFF